jgi:acyl carrier protein
MSTSTFETVAALVRDTLGWPADAEVRAGQLLFYDLRFTSMDLLDLLFRVEHAFDIAIEPGTLYGLARGDLADAAFADAGGVLTPLGRARLMDLLHDTPREVFVEEIHAATVPRYCTVGAIARLVDHKLADPIARGP